MLDAGSKHLDARFLQRQILNPIPYIRMLDSCSRMLNSYNRMLDSNIRCSILTIGCWIYIQYSDARFLQPNAHIA